jgi:hypothetical protein
VCKLYTCPESRRRDIWDDNRNHLLSSGYAAVELVSTDVHRSEHLRFLDGAIVLDSHADETMDMRGAAGLSGFLKRVGLQD